MTFTPLEPCPCGCGTKIDPASLPGGTCHHSLSMLPHETQDRLRREFKRAHPTSTNRTPGGAKNDWRRTTFSPRYLAAKKTSRGKSVRREGRS